MQLGFLGCVFWPWYWGFYVAMGILSTIYMRSTKSILIMIMICYIVETWESENRSKLIIQIHVGMFTTHRPVVSGNLDL